MERLESEVYDGGELRHGNRIEGPAVVELPYTSIAVGVDQSLECDAFGNFVLQPGPPGAPPRRQRAAVPLGGRR